MGGQQSSRRITIDNEDTNNVIKVSEKVVERLKGTVEEEKIPSAPNVPRSFNPVQVHPQKLPIPIQNPTAVYEQTPNVSVLNATTTALDMKKMYEEELRKNNEYWKRRIENIESSNERINTIWHQEYKKAIEEAERNPMIPSKDKETVPCSDTKSVVIDCYKKNANRPLMCETEVQRFSECVSSVKFRKALSAS